MATAYTYATLVAALQDVVEDDGAELLAALDNIIALAEDRLLRDLDLEIFDTVTALAFTATNPLLTKPTNTVGVRTLHYTDGSGNFVLLEPKSWEFIKDFWPNASTTTATPKYFADYSATQWYLAGTPSGTNVVTARCIVRPAGLTSVNTTTWLGTNTGDLMYYACLVSTEQYLKADNRIGVWKTEYVERLKAARREMKLEERSDYMPMTVTPSKEP